MWYFSWILGLSMAVMFGILNAMWLDMHLDRQSRAATKTKVADDE